MKVTRVRQEGGSEREGGGSGLLHWCGVRSSKNRFRMLNVALTSAPGGLTLHLHPHQMHTALTTHIVVERVAKHIYLVVQCFLRRFL